MFEPTHQPTEQNMNFHRKPIRLLASVLSLLAVASLSQVSQATGTVSKGDLNGPWVIVLTGNTGCGISAMHVSVNLANGTGTATSQGNSTGCGIGTSTGLPFTIETLNGNGAGTASLGCGPGCGWNFEIQVAPDRSTFSLVDVTNSLNTLTGVAIHQ
jgi:hypothetical protein